MNELIPIRNEQVSSPEDEMSLSLFSPSNPNRILIFIIPIAFLFLSRNKDFNIFPKFPSLNHGTNTYKPMTSPLMSLDSDMLDKMKLVIDGLKKAQSIQQLRKNMSKTGGQPGKMNFDMIKEVLDVVGGTMGEGNKSQIQNVANMMSMFEKVRDVKKIMDVQKTVKSEGEGDSSSQINNMIELIRPMLPEEQAKNIDSIKKMAQMMKLMSLFDGSGGEVDSENTVEDD